MIRNLIFVGLLALVSCGGAVQKTSTTKTKTVEVVEDVVPEPKFTTVEIIEKLPHAVDSYTQGLLIHDGKMYESIGEYGHSALRRVDIATGKVEKEVKLASKYFAEGLALHGGLLYQITWREGKCFVYDLENFKLKETISYDGDGWGLVSYGDNLLMTDGSSTLKTVDPKTFRVISSVEVHDNVGTVRMINELEVIDSMLYANIYMSPLVAVIEPATGLVVEYIDCTALTRAIGNSDSADVLNGIAHDSASGKTYFTGKLWDTLFEVRR